MNFQCNCLLVTACPKFCRPHTKPAAYCFKAQLEAITAARSKKYSSKIHTFYCTYTERWPHLKHRDCLIHTSFTHLLESRVKKFVPTFALQPIWHKMPFVRLHKPPTYLVQELGGNSYVNAQENSLAGIFSSRQRSKHRSCFNF
uniref:Uncharacterized protein n=1 Tax=Rhipicephalus zambeziensis TaxID=60191 RepID=A0A224Y6B5_9ACAR